MAMEIMYLSLLAMFAMALIIKVVKFLGLEDFSLKMLGFLLLILFTIVIYWGLLYKSPPKITTVNFSHTRSLIDNISNFLSDEYEGIKDKISK